MQGLVGWLELAAGYQQIGEGRRGGVGKEKYEYVKASP